MKVNYIPEQKRYNSITGRSGWKFAMKSLKNTPLSNIGTILFDSWVDQSFLHEDKEYKEPWVGVIHNPPGDYSESCDELFKLEKFQNSLHTCSGLFVFSEEMKNWLMNRPEVEDSILVSVLRVPTDRPKYLFNFESFEKNKNKKIIQIGNWLRNNQAIENLGEPRFLKRGTIIPIIHKSVNNSNKVSEGITTTKKITKITKITNKKFQSTKHNYHNNKSIETFNYLTNDEYDFMLHQNIVFLNLRYTSSCNTIIECIVRNTPILVNKLPAVIEYLGEEYPFYYKTLDEALIKVNNIELIHETTRYLRKLGAKDRYTPKYFIQSILDSNINKSL
jgi:hypothetical protein